MMAALALVACVAIEPDDEELAAPSPSPTGAEAPADPTPSPSPAVTPAETVHPANPLGAALDAAGEVFRVPTAAECPGTEDCIEPLAGVEGSAAGGLAVLAYVTGNGGGAIVLMGRDAAGDWGLWTLTQAQEPRIVPLPGSALVCANTETLALRAEPSAGADASGQVARQQTVEAHEFMLTEHGGIDADGDGWYRVTGPADGWIHADDLVEASLGDCAAGANGGPVG